MVKLVFLGRLREIAGPHLAEVALPENVRTLGGLRDWLSQSEPLLGQALAATRTQFAINQVLARDPAQAIAPGDEIAFLPPMSGG